MSYCRWSSDGFWCDLYCYQHVEGFFMTHVARSRRPRRVTDIDWSSAEALQASVDQQRKDLADPTNQPEPIGLPHDGENICDDTIGGMIATMKRLKSVGYNVPDWAIKVAEDQLCEQEVSHAPAR